MACALTQSILLDCRDSVGGIREVKVKVLPNSLTDYTVTSGVVTIASGSRTGWYSYQMEKEVASFTETTTVNVQNGTVFHSQELKLIINKLRASVRNELVLLAQNRIQVAVKDRNNNYWLLGYENGMDLTQSVNGTGTAYGDRSGYDMSFKGMEANPHINMSEATYTSLVSA